MLWIIQICQFGFALFFSHEPEPKHPEIGRLNVDGVRNPVGRKYLPASQQHGRQLYYLRRKGGTKYLPNGLQHYRKRAKG